jgi:hypothetical protein
MDKLHTTIRKVLNEGIGYAVDQVYGGYARPVYGGNDNNQGAFRRIGMGDRRSQPTDYKGGVPPIVDPYYNNNQYRRIGMGGRYRAEPKNYYSTPMTNPIGVNSNFADVPLPEIADRDGGMRPVNSKPPYRPITNSNGTFQSRIIPAGGRSEPTDFGGYANPYRG